MNFVLFFRVSTVSPILKHNDVGLYIQGQIPTIWQRDMKNPNEYKIKQVCSTIQILIYFLHKYLKVGFGINQS